MDLLRLAAQRWLETAIAAYGGDLPLPVPAARGRPAAATAAGRSEPGDARSSTAAANRPVASPVAGPAAARSADVARRAAPAAAPSRPATSPPPVVGAAARAPGTPPGVLPAGAAPDDERLAAALRDPASCADLATLQRAVLQCQKCKLCEQRRSVVFGEGNPNPPVLFVGEAPGAVEDRTGRPFVGPAGQLLDRILENAMGLRREDVFIANVNKCRPPGNRDPEPDEVASCLPFLRRQVELLQPRVIVALGRIAAHNLLGTTEPMRALRGRDLAYAGIPVVVTWHPAFLLRDPSRKAETWADVKRVNRLLGRPEDPRQAAAAP